MTWYQDVVPLQEPFDLTLDPAGDAQWAFNIAIVKHHSNTTVQELVQYLEDQLVGTEGTTIFFSASAILPTDRSTAFLHLMESGGMSPQRTHNDVVVPAYPRPTVQVVATAANDEDAKTLIQAAYDALVKVKNQQLNP